MSDKTFMRIIQEASQVMGGRTPKQIIDEVIIQMYTNANSQPITDDIFEPATQKYIQAVREYKLAMKELVDRIGWEQASSMLEHAADRICKVDQDIPVIIVSNEEVKRRADRATGIVDAKDILDYE